MKNKIVKIVFPVKSSKNNFINISKSPISISKTVKTIYDVVDFFEQNIFLKLQLKSFTKQIKHKIQLRSIINLHNNTGIKNLSQIKNIQKKIESGEDIFNPNGLPNIKLIKTEDNDWVLFDGHHSLIAYMYSGKKYLHEIPHLIVGNEKKVNISNKEILVFFGEHSNKIKPEKWKDYTINWQRTKNKQLCKRIQKNIGELFDSFKIR